jgi:hypothetical protein
VELSTRSTITAVLAGALILLTVVSFAAIQALASWAAGLVWWAGLALLLTGPLAVGNLVLAMRSPRRKIAAVISAVVAAIHAYFWALILF